MGLKPDCFVGSGIHVVSFVHHMAKRFGQNRYVLVRDEVRGYMVSPWTEEPESTLAKHVKKLVLNKPDGDYLMGKGA